MAFGNTPDAGSNTPGAGGKLSAFVRLLCRNLGVGVRAALLLPFSWERVAASWLLIAALMVLTLAPSLIAQLAHVGLAGEFYGFGLPGALYTFSTLLLLAVIAARLLGSQQRIAALIVVLVSASIVIDAAIHVLFSTLTRVGDFHLYDLPQLDYLRGYWLGLASVVVLLRFGTQPRGRRWLVAIATGVLVGMAINLVWQDRTLWDIPYDDEAAMQSAQQRVAEISDEVIYRQPQLLADRLVALQPGATDSSDLYFIGVAGYGAQRVFLREIRSVNQVMLRFASATHSMLLINSTDTLHTDPIASVTSIRQALARIGGVMDRRDDVLFLYLTSHGSKDHRLSLQLPPLKLADLEPATLRQALDDAGIEWRVIVISACYAGGFIDALAGDKTLVITAAASDRTSFGCSDENDYTYFGRAYFEQALARTDSFIEAFELARASVTEREQAEGETPSNPQISIGKTIADKLATLPRPAVMTVQAD